jgi:hypothetical protein
VRPVGRPTCERPAEAWLAQLAHAPPNKGGGAVRVSPNPQPPHVADAGALGGVSGTGGGRPAVVRRGGSVGPGGVPLLLLSPSSVFVRHPHVAGVYRQPPAMGRL